MKNIFRSIIILFTAIILSLLYIPFCMAMNLQENNFQLLEVTKNGITAEVIATAESANGGPQIKLLKVDYPKSLNLQIKASLWVTKGSYKIELLDKGKPTLILTSRKGQSVNGSGSVNVDADGFIQYRVTAKKAGDIVLGFSLPPLVTAKAVATTIIQSDNTKTSPKSLSETVTAPPVTSTTASTSSPAAILPTNKHANFIRLFESGDSLLPYNQRTYSKEFSATQTRLINWELNLVHPAPGQRIEYDVEAICKRIDGSLIARKIEHAFIEADMQYPYTSGSIGNDIAGKYWQPGVYMIELYIGGEKITTDSFKVY